MALNWKSFIEQQKQEDYFQTLLAFLKERRVAGATIYPPAAQRLRALKLPLEEIKVVILGQDPYHGPGQANGLAFSVNEGVPLPPSLKNIFKELESDLGIVRTHGDLSDWEDQGVCLLNAMLTVERGQAGAHQKVGWQTFTNRVIKHISDHTTQVVFILWGKFAQSKSELIDEGKHLVIKSPHPSPFSAHYGFFGSKPFSKCNAFLAKVGKELVEW